MKMPFERLMKAFWHRRESATRKCERCRSRAATFRSQVSGRWLCDQCNPCYCNWCHGRVGVHGPEAVALYRAEAEALSAADSRERAGSDAEP